MGAPRRRMTMRCETERATPQGTRQDVLGRTLRNTDSILTDQPCYWQARSAQTVESDETIIVVTVHRMMFPLAADIKERDIVTSVRDRRGRILQGDRMRVLAAPRLEDHIQVTLEDYG